MALEKLGMRHFIYMGFFTSPFSTRTYVPDATCAHSGIIALRTVPIYMTYAVDTVEQFSVTCKTTKEIFLASQMVTFSVRLGLPALNLPSLHHRAPSPEKGKEVGFSSMRGEGKKQAPVGQWKRTRKQVRRHITLESTYTTPPKKR